MPAPNPSRLDYEQCIQGSYDEVNGRLRVETELASVNIGGQQEILITDDVDSIKIGDGNQNYVAVNPDGSINVDIQGGTVTGTFIASGLNIAGKVTTMNVTTTAIALPPIPLTLRNAMSITNISNEILYIGFSSSVTADNSIGTNAGWEVGPGEGFNIDVQGSIPVYGIAATGPILIKIMELS